MNPNLLSRLLPKPTSKIRVYLVRHGETNWNLRGKIQGGGYDVPLNDTGRDQAQRAARALSGIPLDAVASSSLSRAKETADILWERQVSEADATSVKPLRIMNEGFNEMRFGVFEGFEYRRKDKLKESSDTKLPNPTLIRQERFLVARKKNEQDRDYCFPSEDQIYQDHHSSGDHDDKDEAYRIDQGTRMGESTNLVESRALEALSQTIEKVLEKQLDPTGIDSNDTKHVAIVSHGRTNKILLAAMLSSESVIRQSNTSINVVDHPGPEEGKNWKSGWIAQLLNYTNHITGDKSTER